MARILRGSWTKIWFTLATEITIKDARASKVFGRIHGDRDDSQQFWAPLTFPWTFPADRWNKAYADWRQHAQARLDTYRSPFCKCKSLVAEIGKCDLHRNLEYRWQRYDLARQTGNAEIYNEALRPAPGIKPETVMVHREYPWVRASDKRWYCAMCQMSTEAIANPSYRNQFILKHSHCGFDPGKNIDLPGTMPSPIELIAKLVSRVEDQVRNGTITSEQGLAIVTAGKFMVSAGRDFDVSEMAQGPAVPALPDPGRAACFR